jgi:hypothetical protein
MGRERRHREDRILNKQHIASQAWTAIRVRIAGLSLRVPSIRLDAGTASALGVSSVSDRAGFCLTVGVRPIDTRNAARTTNTTDKNEKTSRDLVVLSAEIGPHSGREQQHA